jgi:hypothetical protein
MPKNKAAAIKKDKPSNSSIMGFTLEDLSL